MTRYGRTAANVWHTISGRSRRNRMQAARLNAEQLAWGISPDDQPTDLEVNNGPSDDPP